MPVRSRNLKESEVDPIIKNGCLPGPDVKDIS